MNHISHEKWGKFIETDRYGQVLAMLYEKEDDDESAVRLIARYKGSKQIELNVPFSCRTEAKLFLEWVDAEEAQRRITYEIEWQIG